MEKIIYLCSKQQMLTQANLLWKTCNVFIWIYFKNCLSFIFLALKQRILFVLVRVVGKEWFKHTLDEALEVCLSPPTLPFTISLGSCSRKFNSDVIINLRVLDIRLHKLPRYKLNDLRKKKKKKSYFQMKKKS